MLGLKLNHVSKWGYSWLLVERLLGDPVEIQSGKWEADIVPVVDFAVSPQKLDYHDDVIKWKHFHVIGPLFGEFTGHQWIPLTKASDAELWCFPWSAPQ